MKQKEIGAIREDTKKWIKEVENLGAEKAALSLKVHNLSLHKCPKVETVKRELAEKEGLIKRMKIEQNDWTTNKARLINELESLQRKLKDLENQIEQEKGKNSVTNSRLKATEERNTELLSKLEKGTQCIEKAESGKRKFYTVIRAANKDPDGTRSKRTKHGPARNEMDIVALPSMHLIRKSKLGLTTQDKENNPNCINNKSGYV